MSTHEALEHAEHVSHTGHGHDEHSKGNTRLIGLTMALIGVLLAFCAAMVGSERNELTRAMIEQTQAHADYTSASTKFRIVMMELEKLRTGPRSADGKASPLQRRFIRLYMDYDTEKTYSKNWADSFQPTIEAHFRGAESYEKAQLIAEIGIVIASMAVLLSNRFAWYASIVLALLCVGQLGRTWQFVSSVAGSAEHKIEVSAEAYTELRKAHSGANQDEATVEFLDPGGKLRAEMSSEMKAEHGAEHGSAAHSSESGSTPPASGSSEPAHH